MKKFLHIFRWYDYGLIVLIFILSVGVAATMEMIFDESLYLQVPFLLAKESSYNLIYPIDSFNGFIGVTLGPTVLLPIALVFKLLGVGVLKARIIPCFYFTGLFVLFWCQALRDQNRVIGFLFVLSILSIPSIFLYGVTVHGEVPSLFFVVLGILLWKPNSNNFIGLTCFGLAAVTKTYFLLYVIPIFGVVLVEEIKKKRPSAYFFKRVSVSCLIFLIPSALWEIAKFFYMGTERFVSYITNSFSFISSKFSDSFDWSIMVERLRIIFEGVFPEIPFYLTGVLFLAVFVFNIYRLIVNKDNARTQFLFFGLVTYTVWFLFISTYGWWRLFFPFGLIFVYLFFDLVKTVWLGVSRSAILLRYFSAIAFIFGFVVFILKPGVFNHIAFLNGANLSSQRAFAEKITEYNNLEYKFGVWGWWQAPEISFLSGGIRFHNIANQCGKPYKGKYLIIYTKLHKNLDPDSVTKLLECVDKLIYSSPDNNYLLYEPVDKP